MKERIDVHLCRTGAAPSREKARALIMAGQVFIGEKRVDKASETVDEDCIVQVRGNEDAYVSRGAYKLERAFEVFRPDAEGKVLLDIGAASGGFTDVLLRHGAAHVYAVDVGYGQFDWKLRNDPRVTLMERTNARLLTPDRFPSPPDGAVMDVSFISTRLIIPTLLELTGHRGRIITLVKPQFEAGKGAVGKNGVVREAETHRRVLAEIRDFCPALSYHVEAFTYSPIKGPKGNIEFLADICPGCGPGPSDEEIRRIVDEAHVTCR